MGWFNRKRNNIKSSHYLKLKMLLENNFTRMERLSNESTLYKSRVEDLQHELSEVSKEKNDIQDKYDLIKKISIGIGCSNIILACFCLYIGFFKN